MARIFLIGRNHITRVAQVMARQGRDGQLLDLLVYLRALTACHLFLFSYLFLFGFGLGFEFRLKFEFELTEVALMLTIV